ncbi:MAG TPA: type II secretion system F family protein [Thiotrichaceae bacterium]|jgi:MSHA biogenesis protein MshG|nr:type II secretion system F family protein [Thiotrichaceae bacterium]HIM08938.1 type II secretion system F family protein [Gammaproteobacteria bacterium]
MPLFSYRGRNARGGLINGEIDAGTIDAVASQLFNTGITPIDIKEKRTASGPDISLSNYLNRKAPSLDDLIFFSRQMYTLMKAGVPMLRSITGLIQSSRNFKLIEALKDMMSHLESGRDLSSSLARHPDMFSPLYISMVKVGEETGRLEESFFRISEYLAREKETRERIKTALRYPIFVIVTITIAVAIINIWVIPVFAELFAKSGVTLPWQTRVLIAMSDFFVQWWPAMLLIFIGGIIAAQFYVNTENGRFQWDRYKLKIPIVGNIIYRATLARFARSFSMGLKSGVPLIQALIVVSRSVDNEYISDKILGMRTGVERGESLTRTAGLTKMFTPLVIQMLAVGEETGQVDDMMVEVAEYYDREVDYDIKNLSSMIEPILIVVIGVMVLILALGVFLPMWNMTKVI